MLSDVLYYLGIYAALTMGAMALVFGRAFTWAGIVVRAAGRKPHDCRWTLGCMFQGFQRDSCGQVSTRGC